MGRKSKKVDISELEYEASLENKVETHTITVDEMPSQTHTHPWEEWKDNQIVPIMLSKYVSQQAFQFSSTGMRRGIPNVIPPNLHQKAVDLSMDVLDLIFEHFTGNVHIDSGYRSTEVNALVGGVATSQHCQAEAADLIAPSLSVEAFYQLIKSGALKLEFDQLIQEFGGWVHISYVKGRNRRECLRATWQDGKAVYALD